MAGHWLSNIILIVFDSTSTTREENLHICHNMGCWISYDVIVALLCSQICLATIYCWQTCFVAEWKKFCGCRMDFVGELCGETVPLCFYGGALCGELCHCGWTPCAGEAMAAEVKNHPRLTGSSYWCMALIFRESESSFFPHDISEEGNHLARCTSTSHVSSPSQKKLQLTRSFGGHSCLFGTCICTSDFATLM